MKSILPVSLAFCVLVLASCSKSSSGESNTELLTKASWKHKNSGADVNNDGFIDTALPPGYVFDCDKDNIMTFVDNGTGTVDEGPTKCEATDPQTTPFTWSFINGEAGINFPTAAFAGINGDFKILKLTATEFNLSKELNLGGGTVINIIVELQH
jgi:hypothetical protein